MKITNQKNGRMGQTIYHKSTDYRGAVAALAAQVYHILSDGGNRDTLICDYMTAKGTWASITSTDLIKSIRLAALTLHLQDTDIDLNFIGVHSLQIAHLSNGVAASMSILLPFVNIAVVKKRQP